MLIETMRAENIQAKGETALRLEAIAREQRALQAQFEALGQEGQRLQGEQIVREQALALLERALLESRLEQEGGSDHAGGR